MVLRAMPLIIEEIYCHFLILLTGVSLINSITLNWSRNKK